MDYLYDGSFEGFLTAVYHHYYGERATGIYTKENYQQSMINPFLQIETEAEKSDKVYEAIKKKISKEDLRRIYSVFLSSVTEKENKLLDYICLGFKVGSNINLMHGNSIVFEVQQAEKKVTFEVHRLLGLIRFSVLEAGVEILYSRIEPDHDVLELLTTHFCDRYKHSPFIIFDARRGKALIAREGQWYISDFSEEELPKASESEFVYRKLWKSYFDTMAIQERINPKCQKNFMPVRYWKNLTEMSLKTGI